MMAKVPWKSDQVAHGSGVVEAGLHEFKVHAPMPSSCQTPRRDDVTFHSPFPLGARVYADGCDDLTMIVTAFQWRSTHVLIECSWMAGQAYTAWIEPWRLKGVG